MLLLLGAVIGAISLGNKKIVNLSAEHQEQLEKSEARFQRLIENSPVPIAVTNLQGFLYANPAFAKMLGVGKPDQLLGQSIGDFMHPDYRQIELNRIERVVNNRIKAGLLEQKIIRSDGIEIDVKTLSAPIVFAGQPAAQVTFQDITTSKHIQHLLEKNQRDLETEIRESTKELSLSNQNLKHEISQRVLIEEILSTSEKHFRSLIESSLDLIVIMDAGGKVRYANPTVQTMTGFGEKDVIGASIFDFIHPDDAGDVRAVLEKVISRVGEVQGIDFRTRHKDGGYRTVEVLARNMLDLPAVNGVMVTIKDVTERRKAQKQIEYLSFYDRLTGLHNRAFFEEEILRIDTNRHLPITLIVADINGLKLVNDAFGHVEGDELLNRMAQVLKLCCRREDIIARWGGDEFALLLLNSPGYKADELCQRISQLCLEKVKGPVPLSLAMGHATKQKMEQNIKDILKEAEENMYRSKMMASKKIRTDIMSHLLGLYYQKGQRTREQLKILQGLAQDMASARGLNQSETLKLQQVLEYCDIGNIAIEQKLFKKKDRLTSEEWKMMYRHPEIGYHIVQNTPETADLAEPILAHHEWWDGSGYPRNLRGEDIPLYARIVSILNTYDALTQKRPYRKAVRPEQAIKEIKRCAGTQFDPFLVEVMEEITVRQDLL
ncbi:MAG: PAS domain S-box protein [Candidatus Edwardsbacteria bacterium]|nr:PAS domain S-box protein [Candidatus Edwardsbacteria bacterium]MBU1577646.1 PAS domain S-box protein [Candidatus Edwardsbacteria bacterium]MBU2463005.1 PAS domain S-box protein [Candidatus Edwardsbacteria bacterium]